MDYNRSMTTTAPTSPLPTQLRCRRCDADLVHDFVALCDQCVDWLRDSARQHYVWRGILGMVTGRGQFWGETPDDLIPTATKGGDA